MRYKKENEFSYALGATLTFELLATRPELVEEVFYNGQTSGELAAQLKERCGQLGVPVSQNNKIFNLLSSKENCYVLARFKKFHDPVRAGAPHVVLVNPSNAGNLGTIIRSAVGFSVRDIAVVSPAADCFDPKTVRASMGSIFRARVEYFASLEEYLGRFPDCQAYPFMLRASTDLRQISSPDLTRTALIFGNEATGLDEKYLGLGTPVVIRHSGAIDSLNLQTAVSLALYQFTAGVEDFG